MFLVTDTIPRSLRGGKIGLAGLARRRSSWWLVTAFKDHNRGVILAVTAVPAGLQQQQRQDRQ